MANPNIVSVQTIRGMTTVRRYVKNFSIPLITNASSSQQIIKVNSLYVTHNNTNKEATVNVFITLTTSTGTITIANNITVPVNATFNPLEKSRTIYVGEGESLNIRASSNDRIGVVCSYEQISDSSVSDRNDDIVEEVSPVTYLSATGGTVSTYTSGDTYKQHIFTSNGSFVVTNDGEVEVLVVGGGGGGGMLGGGGGGGGVTIARGTITAGTYSVEVGQGGAAQVGWSTSAGQVATKGGRSSVFGVIAHGGGGARSYSNGGLNSENQNVANYGGVGNGQTYASVSASFASNSLPSGWVGTIYHQNSGGVAAVSCCPCNGGGGGGAGGPGIDNNNSNSSSNKTNGGPGVSPVLSGVPLYNGQVYYFGGGGGADGYCSASGGDGGIGAGGAGAGTSGTFGTGGTGGINNPVAPNVNGSQWGGYGGVNTGGGGGAGSNGSGSTSVRGGLGGSGIVVIRYLFN